MSASDHDMLNGRGVLAQLSEILQDARELARLEAQLARQETVEKVTAAAQSGGMMIGGGLLATIGSIYLLNAVTHVLALVVPRWLASLIVGTCLVAGGIAMVQRGTRDLRTLDVRFEKTMTNLREDTVWLSHQIKSRLT
jgi:hypothetical protein